MKLGKFSVTVIKRILLVLQNKMSYKPVTHVIFDLDGTLIDTEGKYEQVLQEIAVEYGTEFTESVRTKTLGRTELDTAKVFLCELGLTDKLSVCDFLKIYEERSKIVLAGVNLMPGAKKLILHLHKNKIPFAIATSSSKHIVAVKTAHLKEIFDLFHHKVMGSSDPEVKIGKPAPDIYLICASRFSPPAAPEKCLVFEDAPNGVKAGLNAGMQVVAVPDSTTCSTLYPQNTTLFLKTMEAFIPEQFGLPPYDN